MNEVISVKCLHPWIIPVLQGFMAACLSPLQATKLSLLVPPPVSPVLQEKEGSEPH